MEILVILLTIIGLSLFEIITSIDNAVINAEVLSGMSKKARRWFLTFGFFFAVFVVRGVLPFLIIWIANPSISPLSLLSLGGGSAARDAIEHSAPILLIAGGVFLLFLFFHWLFIEPKHYGIRGEKFFHAQGAWFFAIVSILLTVIVWFALGKGAMLAFGAVVGSTGFFLIHGFRQFAQQQEERLLSTKNNISDLSKLAYLEVLDTTFSIDGVIGAFAFTFAVPLILLGNGLGAIVLRQLTISNIERIKRYKYLKNGAMYSIFFLGSIMILDSFGFHIPAYLSPIITFGKVGYFFYLSRQNLAKEEIRG